MNTMEIARELQAIAQTGLHFAENPYDRERYERVGKLAAELLASYSNLAPRTIYDWNAAEFGYATPKVDVRAFVVRAGRVLLIRENADAGKWTLPGGWADVNETPAESVVREVREESGYEVEPRCLLAVLDRERQGHSPPFPYHVYKLFFHCAIVGGAPAASAESSESRFFDRGALPELSTSRVLPAQIERFFEAVTQESQRAEYD